MKKLAIAASVIAVSISKAFAADLSTKLRAKAPLVAPGFRWSGFYIGGGGQGFLTSDASAQDSLTGLLFHSNCMLSAGYGFKRQYRRPSPRNVFVGNGVERLRSAGRQDAIGFPAGRQGSDRLAA